MHNESRVSLLGAVIAIATIASISACAGEDDAEFRVNLPTAPTHALTVSALGVYRDGKMSPDDWGLGEAVLAPFGGAACSPLYSKEFVAAHAELALAIDHDARTNGVTESLLGALTPAAASDAILLIEISGRPPKVLRTETSQGNVNPSRKVKSASGAQPRAVTDGNSFDVDVSAYSVVEHKIIAELAMRYTGKQTDHALQLFTDRLGTTFPGWKCAAWKPEISIDPKSITAADAQ